jgi:hypothetical protein
MTDTYSTSTFTAPRDGATDRHELGGANEVTVTEGGEGAP